MKIVTKIIIVILVIIALVILVVLFKMGKIDSPKIDSTSSLNNFQLNHKSMIITSSAFAANQTIPDNYGCRGQNINPPLAFKEVPTETKSLVLIIDDPDAPGGDWVHWLLWNMDPKIDKILENSVPAGATEGLTDFGNNQYGGPCPPSGTHHYQFKLYALDKVLELAPTTKKSGLEKAMANHILDQVMLIGSYSH